VGRKMDIAKETVKGMGRDVADLATGGDLGRTVREGYKTMGKAAVSGAKKAGKFLKERLTPNQIREARNESLKELQKRKYKQFKKVEPLSKLSIKKFKKTRSNIVKKKGNKGYITGGPLEEFKVKK